MLLGLSPTFGDQKPDGGKLGNEVWYMYKATKIIANHCIYMHDENLDTSLPPRLSRLNCHLLSTCG